MFGAGLLSAVELDFGPAPDGQALYYTTYQHEGQVRRIRYGGTDAPPAIRGAGSRSPRAPVAGIPAQGPARSTGSDSNSLLS